MFDDVLVQVKSKHIWVLPTILNFDTNILMTGSDSIDSDLLSYPRHRIKYKVSQEGGLVKPY